MQQRNSRLWLVFCAPISHVIGAQSRPYIYNFCHWIGHQCCAYVISCTEMGSFCFFFRFQTDKKLLKEIFNIVVLICLHTQLFRVRFERKLSSLTDHAGRTKQLTLLNDNEFGIQKQKPILFSEYKQTWIQTWPQLFEIYLFPLQWLILWITLRASAEHFDHRHGTYKQNKQTDSLTCSNFLHHLATCSKIHKFLRLLAASFG